MIKLVMTSNL